METIVPNTGFKFPSFVYPTNASSTGVSPSVSHPLSRSASRNSPLVFSTFSTNQSTVLPDITHTLSRHIHVSGSPMFIRNGFAFDPSRTGSDLILSNNGLRVTHATQSQRFRLAYGNQVMKDGEFMWSVRVVSFGRSGTVSPLLVGFVDSSIWTPGMSLRDTQNAFMVDVCDLEVSINGNQSRIFRKEEKTCLHEGSIIEFFLNCIQGVLYISLDKKPAKILRQADAFNFNCGVVACVELYGAGDAVQFEFPHPSAVVDSTDDEDDANTLEQFHQIQQPFVFHPVLQTSDETAQSFGSTSAYSPPPNDEDL